MGTSAATRGTHDAVILIAHGSRSEAANNAHIDVCRRLGTRIDSPVLPAFLELAEPSLATSVDTSVSDGAQRIVVLPYFLHPGRHIERDIPALIDAARAAHPAVDIECAPLFGADPDVVGLLVAQLTSNANG